MLAQSFRAPNFATNQRQGEKLITFLAPRGSGIKKKKEPLGTEQGKALAIKSSYSKAKGLRKVKVGALPSGFCKRPEQRIDIVGEKISEANYLLC